jgi:hypothetical protein
MSWLSVHEHGDNARILLSVPLTKHTDFLEQLAGQQETFGSKSIIGAAYKLYWSEKTGQPRRGAQGKGQGSPRHLRRFMRQLRMTYDPDSMNADQLIALLPSGFSKWVPATSKSSFFPAVLAGFFERRSDATVDRA